MPKCTIRKLVLDRGFGFIRTTDDKDLFFHRNEVEGIQLGNLREGQEVEFELGQGRDGRPVAVNVRLTET